MSSADATSAERNFLRLWLVALLVIATVIRIQHMGFYYYSPDEAMHVQMAKGSSLSEVWRFSQYETHPPLGNLLRHVWMMLSDNKDYVRAESLLIGLALIVLYYSIGLTLGSEYTAITCATLMAFSHGCIIQSSVVRNYILLVFFLSLGFYYYLQWRESRKPRALLAYTLCGMLAVLTHFSAMLCIFCVALFESALLVRERGNLLRWVAVNGAVLIVAIMIYHEWQPILVPLKSYFTEFKAEHGELLKSTLHYPKYIGDYIYPCATATYGIFALMIVYAFWPQQKPRWLIALASLSLLAGMALYATQIYPPPGTRRSLWILPLILPAAGMAIGDVTRRVTLLLPSKNIRMPFAAIALLVLGFFCYHPADRFSDGSEYAMSQEQFDALTARLGTLTPKDLIVTEKDDGIMLANLYRVMGDDAFTGAHMAVLAPYRHTRILFNPYYPRNYSRSIFLATLDEAQQHHMLDDVGQLVFLRMAWSRSPLTDLMLCSALDKQLITFPSLGAQEKVTREAIYNSLSAVLIISKQTFLSDVLSPTGKARACLDGKHDMVPDPIAGPGL